MMSVRAPHLPHLQPGGLAGAVRARWESSRRRAVADEWLIWGARPQPASPLLAARAAELTSAKMRRQLAALPRRIIAEQSDPRCRAYAVNRPAIRRHLDLFVALAARLEAPEPVGVQGMAWAAKLFNDGGGPLYDPRRAEEVGPTLTRAVRELDVCQ
jgi:hypothetical protein